MACLGSVLYDPGTAATASTAALLAMTAFDITNARITFTGPNNGRATGQEFVLVRIRVPLKGTTSIPSTLLGVLDGATVRGRQAPILFGKQLAVAADLVHHEATFLVGGLTAGTSYTWDAAYGVETLALSTAFGWGGPNNAVASDAYGALAFEVWNTPGLLAGVNYDPAVAVTTNSLAALKALTAIDTTNLRLAFTVPASGRVLVRLRCMGSGGTTPAIAHLGVLEGATVRGRGATHVAYCQTTGTVLVTDHVVYQSEFVVSGLTPAANLTWDAAYGVETIGTSMLMKYGGPNDATSDNAFGGFTFEIWKA